MRDYFFHAQQEVLHKRDSDQPGVPAARAKVVVTWHFFVFGAQTGYFAGLFLSCTVRTFANESSRPVLGTGCQGRGGGDVAFFCFWRVAWGFFRFHRQTRHKNETKKNTKSAHSRPSHPCLQPHRKGNETCRRATRTSRRRTTARPTLTSNWTWSKRARRRPRSSIRCRTPRARHAPSH